MYGSIFYNCWGALLAFTLAFLSKITTPFPLPFPTLLYAGFWGVIGFLSMFAVRALLGYIFYTPEAFSFENHQETKMVQQQPLPSAKQTSTVEFADESAEEMAQVVRTMLQADQK